MSLQIRLALQGDLGKFAHQTHLRIAKGARTAAEKQLARGKLALRGDVVAAGLGQRLANTWRAEIYPRSASVRTHSPAVVFRSAAPEIVTAHAATTVILPKRGAYLAIPTENVPRRGARGGRGQASRWTPAEVEARYGQKLIIFAPGKAGGFVGPGSQFAGRVLLGAIDKSLNRRRARFAKRKRKVGEPPEARTEPAFLSIMFIFVRQVTLRKRLNWPRIFRDLEEGWAQLFPAEIAAALAQD
ncbi:DUF6441 family protein [Hyphomicrobium sp.]|uniref:DUF6441 family protein n=1 Tax=Hyphomicrobium sp. TaxID=82 RepID=UPI0013242F35|nr:DUF6441 family protein [Hyphomicrobium sp.]KAB2937389.1 MAG: hypothetical protein F9K20_20060 [Hyphomicrobium sp.]